MKRNVLVIGAGGQIGVELTAALRAEYGTHRVIAADVKPMKDLDGTQIVLDVLDQKAVCNAIEEFEIDEVYLLAALLSATAEKIRITHGSLIWKAFSLFWSWLDIRKFQNCTGPALLRYLVREHRGISLRKIP